LRKKGAFIALVFLRDCFPANFFPYLHFPPVVKRPTTACQTQNYCFRWQTFNWIQTGLPDGTFSNQKITIWVHFGGPCDWEVWYLYSIAIWNILRMAVWYIYYLVHIFRGYLVYFPRFGELCHEESGNPGSGSVTRLTGNFWNLFCKSLLIKNCYCSLFYWAVIKSVSSLWLPNFQVMNCKYRPEFKATSLELLKKDFYMYQIKFIDFFKSYHTVYIHSGGIGSYDPWPQSPRFQAETTPLPRPRRQGGLFNFLKQNM
jgi:hypothetical protein